MTRRGGGKRSTAARAARAMSGAGDPEPVLMPTAAQLVADAIRRQIVIGELKEGESFPPEATLIERYGVSRPTFREALRILQSEALITIRRGSRGGARVNAPAVDSVARSAGLLLQHQGTTLGDVYEARLIVEPPAAALVARRGGRRATATLREALAEERAARGDAAAFSHASARFHEEVIRLAGNNTLSLFAGLLREIIEAHSEFAYRHERDALERTEHSAAAHERLVELVDAGDAEAAEDHWRAHIEDIGSRMQRTRALRESVDLFQ